MHYLFLALAIILEVVGSTFMKLSDGFSRLLPTAVTIIAYITCFYFLSLALKGIHLGVAYAIWAALGLVLTNIVAIILFKQPFDWAAGLGITLIITGVVILNAFSKASAH
ncbi:MULTISPECIES: DMT family transporter [Prevotellaceae]|uniref:DMT family transporter n=1 Tax=Prevotellaceae TaxID=171552 RepID=UPI0003D2CA48|nr:multidrug efflux SMR transporter [Prevotella phocaeensis]ETD16536.1 hypothetical protein HMPREF1199_02205 [Hoylesella oralis CC98A]